MEKISPRHPWEARLVVSLIMLVLAFIGLVITQVHSTGSFDYWKWVIPIYAFLALWLSWYVRKQMQVLKPVSLWHELLHWLGLIATVLLVSLFVNIGIISRFIAGLFDLTLLSLTLFIAGIYIEITFVFVGIILGVFAFLVAFVAQYLYAFLIPVLLAGALIILLTIWMSHKQFLSK